MKSFSVIGGQCPRRILDAQKICNYLQANSLKHTLSLRKADIIFVNTCGGFTCGEEQSLHTIKPYEANILKMEVDWDHYNRVYVISDDEEVSL